MRKPGSFLGPAALDRVDRSLQGPVQAPRLGSSIDPEENLCPSVMRSRYDVELPLGLSAR